MKNLTVYNNTNLISETVISNDLITPNSKQLLATSSWDCAGMVFELETGDSETMIRIFDQSTGMNPSNSIEFEGIDEFRVNRLLLANFLDNYEDIDAISELVLTLDYLPNGYSVEALIEYALDIHKIYSYPIRDVFRGLRSMRTNTFLDVLEGKITFEEAI